MAAAPGGGRQQQLGAPSLTCIALEALAQHIQHAASLETAAGVLPEELACTLFARVIELGKLNLRVLEMFERTEHESLLEAIREMGIRRWTPPLLPTSRGGPLGYAKPPWQ